VETVVLVTRTPDEALLAERRRLGLDTHDEVWAGEHHMMSPGPSGPHAVIAGDLHAAIHPFVAAGRLAAETNIGEPDDFRVPDLIILHPPFDRTYFDTASLVVEVASPGDDSWRKFDFYAAHAVDEVLIADPDTATLHWFRLQDGRYEPADRSEVLEVPVVEIHDAIDWPDL
jgi:Uma2 family endonuclease